MAVAAVVLALVAGGCRVIASPGSPPPITSPGTSERPRDVNVIARDYSFDPPEVRFVPGETVVIHVINAGLDVHEAVFGDQAVQDAWEAAHAAVEGAPPGPTPVVSVPPALDGARAVVHSGERVDLRYEVPDDGVLFVGCHIADHYERGMVVPVRLVPVEDG